jgi:centromeric protein E
MEKKIKIHLRVREHQRSIWDIERPYLSYKTDRKKYSFDCFDSIIWKEKNNDIYNMFVKSSIEKFNQGENITIFAYGQTGSGKTHTMMGNKEDGLVQISLNDLFPGEIQISFIEIFNEKIYDLFLKKELKLFSSENKCVLQGVHVENTNSAKQAKHFIDVCLENRKTGYTNFNSLSSRSHAILKIIKNGAILTYIDLAGSEKSSNDGKRMKEAAFINKSLLSLGKLVNNILNNKFFGFRDSKLTRLLQDSISSKSSMIAFCMLSPTKECLSESLGTLNFAGRLSNLEIHLAKTEICENFNELSFKSEKINFYELQKEIDHSRNEIINNQKERIKCLESMIINLLKQTKDKKQEEMFLLEKQLFEIKIQDRFDLHCEEDIFNSIEIFTDYLED